MKTVCVYHRIDLDGWMSAAVVRLALEDATTNVSEVKGEYDTKKECGLGSKGPNSLYFFGFNYGDAIPNLTDFDKVVMCDISFPKEEMDKLRAKLGPNFIWIDHHISAINEMQYSDKRDFTYCAGLRDTKFAACELTWKNLMQGMSGDPDKESTTNRMPEIVRLLGLYDSFRHKNTDEEQKVLEFQYGARERITDIKSAYDVLCITKDEKLHMAGEYFDNYINQIYDAGKAIYRYLCTDAKQAYKNGFSIGLSKPIEKIGDVIHNEENKTSMQGVIVDLKPYKFICINKERFNPINFGIDYHNDGYDGAMCWYLESDKMINISFYNDNGQIDCSAIAKSFGGGGHKGAAGCRMTLEQFTNLMYK